MTKVVVSPCAQVSQSHDMLIIIGDANDKVGQDNLGWEKMMEGKEKKGMRMERLH